MFLLSIPLFYACSNSVKPAKYEVFALPYNNNNNNNESSWGSSGVDVVIIDMEKGKVKSYERFSN